MTGVASEDQHQRPGREKVRTAELLIIIVYRRFHGYTVAQCWNILVSSRQSALPVALLNRTTRIVKNDPSLTNVICAVPQRQAVRFRGRALANARLVVEGTWWQVPATLDSSHVSKLMMDYVRTRFSPETIRAVDIGRHLHKDIFEDMVQGLASHSPLLATSNE